MLDAIYHLSYGKGYFNPFSTQNIRHGEELFLVEGSFEKEGQSEKISCGFKKGAKKVLKRNGKIYERITQHIGLLPVVMISPADRDLIAEGSDVRRKFIDGNVAQADPAYLESLLAYQRILGQRNALLKFFAAKIGPEAGGEIKLAIGQLPEQKIADPLLATGANQEIWIALSHGVKLCSKCFLVNLSRLKFATGHPFSKAA